MYYSLVTSINSSVKTPAFVLIMQLLAIYIYKGLFARLAYVVPKKFVAKREQVKMHHFLSQRREAK
jgi:hypothetical protein